MECMVFVRVETETWKDKKLDYEIETFMVVARFRRFPMLK